MPWPPLQPPHVSLSSAKLKIWTGNCQAPLQLSFGGLFIKSRAASRILRSIWRSGWDLYPGISIFLASQRSGRQRLPSLGEVQGSRERCGWEERVQQPWAVPTHPLGFFQKETGTVFSSSQCPALLAQSVAYSASQRRYSWTLPSILPLLPMP